MQAYCIVSNMWGTIPDWIVAITGIVTALFLIKTFQSQKKVQIMQQSIADIEQERYRIENFPVFKITPVGIDNSRIAFGKSTLHFKLILEKNEAREFNVIGGLGIAAIDHISVSQNHNGYHLPIPIVQPGAEYDLHFNVSPLMVLFENEGGYFFFSLNFKDSIRSNSYSKQFSVIFKDDILNFSSNDAQIIG